MHSHVPLVVAGGRFCPGASRGLVTSQPAGRRIPLRLWLVSGDALGERDDRTICLSQHLSKIFGAVHSEAVDILFMYVARERVERNEIR